MNWYRKASTMAMMGIPCALIDAQIIDEAKYELFKGTDSVKAQGIIRVTDADSGGVLTLQSTPDYDQALQKYKELISKAKRIAEHS